MRPLPGYVDRWTSRVRWLRWMDALLAWLGVWLGLSVLLPAMALGPTMVLAAATLLLAAAVPGIRRAWRPVSATVSLLVSRRLRPGDRAWFVHRRDADLVLVTARHGVRVVVARPDQEAAEGMNIRRTRVLLIPAEG
jgi:hypothetical protein